MGHKKLIRFEELLRLPNVLQYPEGMAGTWGKHFGNTNPLTLELACGKGEYAVGLGRLYPQHNFIGVDLKGHRLWVGAKKALKENLGNVAFLRTQIDQIPTYFTPGEVEAIWITFPDPQLRRSKARKRLTHPKFLRLYQQFLQPGGYIHLKTDSPDLYHFTKLVISEYGCTLIEDTDDLYQQPALRPDLQIRTYYESLDIAGSRRVHYLCFTLPDVLPDASRDAALKQLLENEELD